MNDYKTVMSVLNDMADTTKKNEKIAILESAKGSDVEKTVKRTFNLAYDKRISFFIKSWDEVTGDVDVSTDKVETTLDQAYDFLVDKIATREITGNAAREEIQSIYSSIRPTENAEVFKRVVLRDLRCGASASTANKVFPGLVHVHPYMRCSSFTEKNLKKINLPCFSQVKMDGLYIDLVVTDGGVSAYTRSGQPVNHYISDKLQNEVSEFPVRGSFVLSGECVVIDSDGEPLLREDSNGMLNRDEVDTNSLVFYLWDAIPYDDFFAGKSDIPYKNRFQHLHDIVGESNVLRIVDTVVCDSIDDIVTHFRDVRLYEQEGTVVKNFDGKWKDGTSPDQVKIKVVISSEVRVIGWDYGTGKYSDCVGTIKYESQDGIVSGWVGTGLSDAERKELVDVLDDDIERGLVIEVLSNGLVENDENLYSLYLPRIKEFRKDKERPDDLADIREQVAGSTNALSMISTK